MKVVREIHSICESLSKVRHINENVKSIKLERNTVYILYTAACKSSGKSWL
jgi:hypothetical protein